LDYEWHDETGDYYNVGVFTGDDRDYVKVDPEGNTSHYRSYPALLSEAEVTAKSLMTDHQKTMNDPIVQAVHQSHRDYLSHEITQMVAFGMLDIATVGEFAAIRQGMKYLLKKSGKALVVREAARSSKNITNVAEGGIPRIQNAANRINKPIHLVGSRANGTSKALSDFDYVIEGINSRQWSRIKNSLPGAPSRIDNLPRRIDLFRGPLDPTKPHITIYPH
ncbi:MAG: hypothetical protein O3C07_05140, partial [Bacteroidetes bacterium]|nr:hypothetical protein [Bacteroidota bacterium]